VCNHLCNSRKTVIMKSYLSFYINYLRVTVCKLACRSEYVVVYLPESQLWSYSCLYCGCWCTVLQTSNFCKKRTTKLCTLDAIYLFWACEPEDGLIRLKHVVNINTHILQYIYCECIILYLFWNVRNDGMKMKTRCA
jgi:hypothetical protein